MLTDGSELEQVMHNRVNPAQLEQFALGWHCYLDEFEKVRMLLRMIEFHADYSHLVLAVENRNLELVKLLIDEYGVDPVTPDGYIIAYRMALVMQQFDILEYLAHD